MIKTATRWQLRRYPLWRNTDLKSVCVSSVWFEPRHRHFLRSSFCPNDFCLAWSATESALLMNADRLLMHSLITFEIVVAGIGPSTKARDPEPVETMMPVPCSRFAVRML